jgi:hypothetical protein
MDQILLIKNSILAENAIDRSADSPPWTVLQTCDDSQFGNDRDAVTHSELLDCRPNRGNLGRAIRAGYSSFRGLPRVAAMKRCSIPKVERDRVDFEENIVGP